MARKIRFVRLDPEDFEHMLKLKFNLQNDIKEVTGKRIKLANGDVVKFALNPRYNENFIQLDLFKIAKLKKGGYLK